MELIKILKPDFIFEDDRGLLCQITHDSFAQVNAVFTKEGKVRGNFHYHETTDEVFFVLSGEIEVEAVLDQERESRVFKGSDMFLIPRNVRHNFKYIKDTNLVAFYTDRVEKDDGRKDIIEDKSLI